MLSIALLKPGHKFDLGTYIDGEHPSESEVVYARAIPTVRPKVAVAGS
jgi:hypothetical protein